MFGSGQVVSFSAGGRGVPFSGIRSLEVSSMAEGSIRGDNRAVLPKGESGLSEASGELMLVGMRGGLPSGDAAWPCERDRRAGEKDLRHREKVLGI